MAERLANLFWPRIRTPAAHPTLPHLHCVDVIRSNDRTRSNQVPSEVKLSRVERRMVPADFEQMHDAHGDIGVAAPHRSVVSDARSQRTPACLSRYVRSESIGSLI